VTQSNLTNTLKIINDPVHGFIRISFPLLYNLIEHPIIQRLRRIKQLGLTYYVYPGATHTRFNHALGAMYLMGQAIQNIRIKGFEITDEEEEAATAAILLHDIGHGPFSHTLEESIIENIHHEDISMFLMEQLNTEFQGRLQLAIDIFQNKYKKKFLHQLVSSQLDVDRLDYLKRDSFFTGVTEGVIGSDRIIKMLTITEDNLVIEAKGIYSIEKFLIARRLMYWQVYLHKTVLAAEYLMIMLLKRAKYMAQKTNLSASRALKIFLTNNYTKEDLFQRKEELLHQFTLLDDSDIFASAKSWMNHSDKVLAKLASDLMNRNLPKIKLQQKPFSQKIIKDIEHLILAHFNIEPEDLKYLVYTGSISNYAYSDHDENIQILYNNGDLLDIGQASDMFDLSVLNKRVEKYFLCYPKEISELIKI
jgi:HD superfamily phosphohydrolase